MTLPRERIEAALAWRAPDLIPIRLHPSPGGLYDHGEKLLERLRACGSDFGETTSIALPDPPPAEDFDADGRYHAFRTDAWGTRWEFRLFGVWGHPAGWPLADWAALDAYRPPDPPTRSGPGFEAARAACDQARRRFYTLGFGGHLIERLHSLRRFEDVLCDIAADRPEMHRLADAVTEHNVACVEHAVACGVDAVAFGDDYGTQTDLLVSPACWRRFFRPRLEAMFAPVLASGKPIFFHSCGQISAILDDLAEMGVRAIWPQLPVYDLPALARRCRDLGLAVELHPDRGDLMQTGPADAVRRYLLDLVEVFGTARGGSWLYLEIDPGFRWPNVACLFDTVAQLRGSSA